MEAISKCFGFLRLKVKHPKAKKETNVDNVFQIGEAQQSNKFLMVSDLLLIPQRP